MRALHVASLIVVVNLSAVASPVEVDFSPSDVTTRVGGTFSVSLRADISEGVIGFGIGLVYPASLLSLVATDIASPWLPVNVPDHNLLVAFAFPNSVVGSDVALANATFVALGSGIASITGSIVPQDPTQGFPLEAGGFASVSFSGSSISITSVPEPSTGLMISMTLLIMLLILRRVRKAAINGPLLASALLVASSFASDMPDDKTNAEAGRTGKDRCSDPKGSKPVITSVTHGGTASASTSHTPVSGVRMTVGKTERIDLNGDGIVDAEDRSIMICACGTSVGEVGFDPRADLDADGRVTATDYRLWNHLLSRTSTTRDKKELELSPADAAKCTR